MPRFFVDADNIENDSITITGDDAHHIARVLRMHTGDTLTVCDKNGTDFDTVITALGGNTVQTKILSSAPARTEPPVCVTLFQALPKAAKMENIIQKCTELGIYKIIPCIASRCVVKLDDARDALKKTARWQAISEQAAKQCGRGIIPEISEPVTFDEALQSLKAYDVCFAAYEQETTGSLRQVLKNAGPPTTAAFLIGPEGGLAPEEAGALRQNGIPAVTLGPRILRTETAGAAVLAMLMYEIGDVNP